jgi:uncharacterized protein
VRIAAIADLHCRVDTTTLLHDLFGDIQDHADALVLAGDLTDTGLLEEARCLARQLKSLGLPVIAVLGNHDHENGLANEIGELLNTGQICILNGTSLEIDGVGFAGTKGFVGGFGANLVQPFGENELKHFIQTTIDEASRLQAALSRLHGPNKMVILHYAPITATLEGEPEELYPFLGCSRYAEAIDCAGADLIVHGHAHHGSPFGKTPGDIPVQNVSRYVLCGVTDRSYSLIDLDGNKTDRFDRSAPSAGET